MSKEIEQINRIIKNNSLERQTQFRINEEEKNNIRTDSEKRAIENKKILVDSGIVTLFEDIRDSGLLKYSPSSPAKIGYGEENRSIAIFFNSYMVNYSGYEPTESSDKIEVVIHQEGISLKKKEGNRFENSEYISINKENMVQVIGEELTRII